MTYRCFIGEQRDVRVASQLFRRRAAKQNGTDGLKMICRNLFDKRKLGRVIDQMKREIVPNLDRFTLGTCLRAASQPGRSAWAISSSTGPVISWT